MLSFVKKIVLCVKNSLTKQASPTEYRNSVPTEWRPVAPPSYEQVVKEKRIELLTENVKVLQRKARNAQYKYLYAESRYLHVKNELEKMKYRQVRAVLDGKRRASDVEYLTETNILKDELIFLSARRHRLRAEFLYIRTNLLNTREHLRTQKSRYNRDLSRNSRPMR